LDILRLDSYNNRLGDVVEGLAERERLQEVNLMQGVFCANALRDGVSLQAVEIPGLPLLRMVSQR